MACSVIGRLALSVSGYMEVAIICRDRSFFSVYTLQDCHDEYGPCKVAQSEPNYEGGKPTPHTTVAVRGPYQGCLRDPSNMFFVNTSIKREQDGVRHHLMLMLLRPLLSLAMKALSIFHWVGPDIAMLPYRDAMGFLGDINEPICVRNSFTYLLDPA